ncbi:MAG: lantibiotic dehydratase [Myxococcota bacterium]|nr:lantibiotic dehydratase [Myxococcota bacterium]
MERPDAELEPVGFFVLRAPALPFELLAAWAETPGMLRELLRRGDVWEAIYLASPAVAARISAWLDGEIAGEEASKLEYAYVRYVERMCWRTTPFGMFAGVAVGTIGVRGAGTRLALAGRERRTRHTTLDSEWLAAAHAGLVRDPDIRASLTLHPTSHLLLREREVVFVSSRGSSGRHREHTIARTSMLERVLELAASGATRSTLIEGLGGGALAPGAAMRYVDALIDGGLLTDSLEPPVIGGDALAYVTDQLADVPAGIEVRRTLLEIREALRALDEPGAASPPHYARITSALSALPLAVESKSESPVHVVLRHAVTTLELDPRVARDALAGARALCALAPPPATPLREFARAFEARYGERDVPLLEVLDTFSGIGFEPHSSSLGEVPPLIRGVVWPATPAAPATWGARERWLADRVAAAARSGAAELALIDGELPELPPAIELPASCSVTIAIHAESVTAMDAGTYRVHVRRVLGPSGAAILGRFCAADARLADHVRELTAREAALAPDAIIAEIVHTPHPSSNNVMARPALRQFEIAALGASNSAGVTRLELADLLVSVTGTIVQLRSRAYGKRVLPRLSCSDNAHMRGLPVYRFLIALARAEGATSLAWDWGPLADLAELPRIVVGRCILALARWRLDAATLAALTEARGDDRRTAITELRRARRLPRWTMLSLRDLNLPIDWETPHSVEAFLGICRASEAVVIEEMFPGPGGPFVAGEDGRYAAELTIPFLRKTPVPATIDLRASVPLGRGARARAAGDWLYAKLYCSERAADSVLREVVCPVVTEHPAQIERWFFVRYGDPDWHVRVRFTGESAVLRGALEEQLARHAGKGWVHRVAYETYDPEWERYGGADAMPIAEALFHHDSDAALGISIAYAGGSDARWQLALLGMYRALALLVPDHEARVRVIRAARTRYTEQFGLTGRAGRVLGQRYRDLQPRIAEIFGEVSSTHPLRLGIDLLSERDRRWKPFVDALWSRVLRVPAGDHDALVARIVISLAHVHANRVLATDHRLHEAFLCSFLERILGAEHGRAAAAQAT